MRVAVLLPCHNEEQAIGEVVAGFRRALPDAVVYVYDNASTDGTAREAAAAGAVVRQEPVKGKGNVVRRMFADIDADVYVMADGDGTYNPADAPKLVEALIDQRVDMVVGARRDVTLDAGRSGHALGNRMFNGVYRWLFGETFSDIFSGYRAFTRRFAKSFPAISTGFETETEMSVHASRLHIPTAEVEVSYGQRPEGSESKLRTITDGGRILRKLLVLLKENRPLFFYGVIGTAFLLAALVLGIPVVVTFLQTGLVPRLPTAVLATGLMALSAVTWIAGLILYSVARSRVEHKRLVFLGYPPLNP